MGFQGEDRRPAPYEPGGDGCLTVAIRLPVRVVAFVVVLPLRLLWDLLAAVGRAGRAGFLWGWRRLVAPLLLFVWRYLVAWPLVAFYRYLLVPSGIALAFLWRYLVVWPVAAVWRYVLVPGWQVLVVVPVVWVWGTLVVPVARAVAAALGISWRVVAWVARVVGGGLAWTVRVLVVVPVVWVWGSLLVPVGHALVAALAFVLRYLLVVPLAFVLRYLLVVPLAFVLRYLLVVPLAFLWRRVVVPVAREIGVALAFAWRGTAYVSRAIGRGLAWIGRVLIGRPVAWIARVLVAAPVAWVWRRAVVPAAHWYRTAIWRPVTEAVAEARRAVRRALLGTSAAKAHRPPPPAPHRGTPRQPPSVPRQPAPAPVERQPGPGAGRLPEPGRDLRRGGADGEGRTPPHR